MNPSEVEAVEWKKMEEIKHGGGGEGVTLNSLNFKLPKLKKKEKKGKPPSPPLFWLKTLNLLLKSILKTLAALEICIRWAEYRFKKESFSGGLIVLRKDEKATCDKGSDNKWEKKWTKLHVSRSQMFLLQPWKLSKTNAISTLRWRVALLLSRCPCVTALT